MKHLKIIIIGFILAIIIINVIYWENKSLSKKHPNASLTEVTLAMDYTPNTNHTGVYVAQAKGFYKAQGISLKILPYSANVSPDVLVSSGKADIGISYTEGVVSDAASGNPVISIAAIIQHNTSSLVALADNHIFRPRDFDGKIYGGFGAPYETAVVSAIIKKDGGLGNFKNVTLDIDGLQALQSHKIDFAWIFDGWTGVQAQLEGIKLISFPINSHGIADYYTPVFITSAQEMKKHPGILKNFLKATTRGYDYAIAHPSQAAQILYTSVPKGTFSDENFLLKSQTYLSAHYVDPGRAWGRQDTAAWHAYPQFMLDSGAILDASGKPVTSMNFDALFTNAFLPK